jgi:hypothetical protein
MKFDERSYHEHTAQINCVRLGTEDLKSGKGLAPRVIVLPTTRVGGHRGSGAEIAIRADYSGRSEHWN